MTKLTADKARYFIERINAVEKEFGLSIDRAYFRQALEIALPVLEQQESQCQKCGGTGMADSGGAQPWGAAIMVECDCQFEQQESQPDSKQRG